VGVATHNIAVGVGLGVAIGVAIGVITSRAGKQGQLSVRFQRAILIGCR